MKRLALVLMILALGLPTSGCAVRYSRPATAAYYYRPFPPGNAYGLYRGRSNRGYRGHGHGHHGHGRGH